MCEIFAASARKPQRYDTYLKEFFTDAVKHPHGWGLCWHEGTETRLFKEPVTAIESSYLEYLLNMGIETQLLIAHIRNATKGIVAYGNTHPFVANDSDGRQWVFCHNGSILQEELTQPYEKLQQGGTDSERVMLFFLEQLNHERLQRDRPLCLEERWRILGLALAELSPGNKLNLAFDDGEYLYVHSNTEQPTLFVRTTDTEVLICSRPIGDGWEPIERCRLFAYRNGELAFTGEKHNGSFDNDAYLELVASWIAEEQALSCGH
ncbi:MAG: class II glutamine amidotransferase [Atopobiaceae bacterium]|nr:class II glutamine amidotransferase [Atopobiaceae bacterium]